jgi:hypothetical protein
VNKYALGVVFVVFGTLTVSFMVGLKYSQAVLVFGLVSVLSALVVIHKVPNASIATGLFVGLTLFASSPFRKLFQIDGMVEELAGDGDRFAESGFQQLGLGCMVQPLLFEPVGV